METKHFVFIYKGNLAIGTATEVVELHAKAVLERGHVPCLAMFISSGSHNKEVIYEVPKKDILYSYTVKFKPHAYKLYVCDYASVNYI